MLLRSIVSIFYDKKNLWTWILLQKKIFSVKSYTTLNHIKTFEFQISCLNILYQRDSWNRSVKPDVENYKREQNFTNWNVFLWALFALNVNDDHSSECICKVNTYQTYLPYKHSKEKYFAVRIQAERRITLFILNSIIM